MKVVCIKCWAEDSLVKLHLDGSNDFECEACDETYTCDDVRATIEAAKQWEKLLKWVESAPTEAATESTAAN
jgi:hypothetical protein